MICRDFFVTEQYVRQFPCIDLGLKIEECDIKGVPKKLGVKTQISQKKYMLSIMHAKRAF